MLSGPDERAQVIEDLERTRAKLDEVYDSVPLSNEAARRRRQERIRGLRETIRRYESTLAEIDGGIAA